MQVQISLASLAIILISETYQIVPAVDMYFNGLTVTFLVAVVPQGIFLSIIKKCTDFPPPLDSWRLRSRMSISSKLFGFC